MQTRNSASENGNKKPDKMLRNIEPGIANDCKLFCRQVQITCSALTAILSMLHTQQTNTSDYYQTFTLWLLDIHRALSMGSFCSMKYTTFANYLTAVLLLSSFPTDGIKIRIYPIQLKHTDKDIMNI